VYPILLPGRIIYRQLRCHINLFARITHNFHLPHFYFCPALCAPRSAFCLLPSAFCLLPSALRSIHIPQLHGLEQLHPAQHPGQRQQR
jgi:hypothetical protein